MPTARETVPNRALSGAELKRILADDFERLLANEGLLSDHIAFGRVGYDLRLDLHLDNPYHPESSISLKSRPVAGNLVAASPELAAVESAPLADPSPEATVASRRRSRRITSPNAERVRVGLPVPVEVKQQDGTVTTEAITYPPEEAAKHGDGDVDEADVSDETRATWGLAADINGGVSVAPAPDPALDALCHCGHTRRTHALSGICTQAHDGPACEEFRDATVPLAAAPAPQAWQTTTSF